MALGGTVLKVFLLALAFQAACGAKRAPGATKKDPANLTMSLKGVKVNEKVKRSPAHEVPSAQRGGVTKPAVAAELLPEDIRFAANIHNNFMLGGYPKVLNWTRKSMGMAEEAMLTQCTGEAYKDNKLCVKVPFPTPWSKDVDPAAPLPDYPRPQLRREKWLNLNGIWKFQSRGVREMGGKWDNQALQRIVVPYPVESPLSGISHHDADNVEMRYERTFQVPGSWKGQRVLLHFDAVDHEATVSVNGREVGKHAGGYDRFSFDITDQLQKGDNTLVVRAFDPTEFAHIPIGKQRLHTARHPSNIFYTSSSGIWQTVWLEPVPKSYINRIELVPDVDSSLLGVKVFGGGDADGGGKPLTAVVTSKGKRVATAEGRVGETLTLSIPDPQLWSPDSPFLYDLEVSLQGTTEASDVKVQSSGKSDMAGMKAEREKSSAGGGKSGRKLQGVGSFLSHLFGGSATAGGAAEGMGQAAKVLRKGSGDSVTSYFAMRKVSMGHSADGGLRPLLNDEYVFQTGMLDQGFWPDGLYTPATDDALVFDLEFTKELGFNMLRKHTKVESDRWYYHADRLGVLVWQDMPSMFYQDGEQSLSVEDKRQYKAELQRIMQQHFNFPSIVTWVIFNEGWGQHDTVDVVKYAQSLDSTRIFDGASGWTDYPVGDMIDMHNYPGPGSPSPTDQRCAVLGEYGGLGKRTQGHEFVPDDSFAYEMHDSAASLQERYAGMTQGIADLMVNPDYFLSAAVYTEVSDVEAEINGWVTYDRQVKKVDPKVIFQANQELITKSKAIGRGSDRPLAKIRKGNAVRVNPSTERTPGRQLSRPRGMRPGVVS